MLRSALVCTFVLVACCFVRRDSRLLAAALTTQPGGGQDPLVDGFEADITILGKLSDLKRMVSPSEALGPQFREWIDKPRDITLDLLQQKRLEVQTRPLLILGRQEGTVVKLTVPPAAGQAAWLRERAGDLDKLLV